MSSIRTTSAHRAAVIALLGFICTACDAFSLSPAFMKTSRLSSRARAGRIEGRTAVGLCAVLPLKGADIDNGVKAAEKDERSWARALSHRGRVALGMAATSAPILFLAQCASAQGLIADGGTYLADASGFTTDALIGGMLAGAVAGAAVDLILYPIDTVKTRMQTKSTMIMDLSEWKQLYAGLSSSLAGHVPSSAIFFAAYETSKVFIFQPSFGVGSPLSQIIASAVGNVAASTLRVPTEVVKTRMQSGADQGFWNTVGRILSIDGPGGLYRGYSAFLLRDLPFDTIEFVAYEQLKIAYVLLAHGGVGALEGWETALIGAVAGGLTGAVTTPLDTLRARLMNEAGEENKGQASLTATAQLIVQQEGWQGLFAGVAPRVLWLSLGGTVFFTSLEAAKSVFLSG